MPQLSHFPSVPLRPSSQRSPCKADCCVWGLSRLPDTQHLTSVPVAERDQSEGGRLGGAGRGCGDDAPLVCSDQLVMACVEKLREKSGMRDITMTNSE